MKSKKMAVAVFVTIIATVAAISATAHSRKILQQEQQIYPPGVLKLGEEAQVSGLMVAVQDADVVESVATIEMRGYERRAAAPDHRFLRLTLSVENTSDKPGKIESLVESLRLIELSTEKPIEAEFVWLRGYDALPKVELAPGERAVGKIAFHVSQYALVFPFLAEIGHGAAHWGVDVIDRDAPLEEFL